MTTICRQQRHFASTEVLGSKKAAYYYWPGANVSGTIECLANLVACAVLRALVEHRCAPSVWPGLEPRDRKHAANERLAEKTAQNCLWLES